MNTFNPVGRWLRALPGVAHPRIEPVGRLDLIGIDMAPTRRTARHRMAFPAMVGLVIGALLIAGQRMDVVRMRYAIAEAVTLERQLLEEKSRLTVSLRHLREPKLLSERAVQLGFAKPDRLINLVQSIPATRPVGAGPRP